MGTLNSVQERLDYLIKIKKMSENAFMKATGTNNIGKMRSGKLSISEGTISKICNSLGVSYSWLKYEWKYGNSARRNASEDRRVHQRGV